MVEPLTALSLAVAAGLALFATALALPRPAHPPARVPLLALLIGLTVLVLRRALLGLGFWTPGPVELAIALATFIAIPVLLLLVAEAAVGQTVHRQTKHWGLFAIPVGAAIGLASLLGLRGETSLHPGEWQAFVVGLLAISLVCAAGILKLRHSPRPAWLSAVLGLFAIHWGFSAASWIIYAFELGPNGLATWLEIGSLVSLFVFGAVAVVRALRSFPAMQPLAAAPYTGSGLDEDLCRQRASALHERMRTHKPHLNPELSAADLAASLGLTSRELSQVLNVEIGQGFFEFVNAYRIEEATRQLASPDQAEATILEILYRSGFNSKSAFHRAFKTNVGMTPSQYRRLQIEPFAAKAA